MKRKLKIIIPILIATTLLTAGSVLLIKHNKVVTAQNQIKVLQAEIDVLEYKISQNEKIIEDWNKSYLGSIQRVHDCESENLVNKRQVILIKNEITECLEVMKENS